MEPTMWEEGGGSLATRHGLMSHIVPANMRDDVQQISVYFTLGESIRNHISCVNPERIPAYPLEDFVPY